MAYPINSKGEVTAAWLTSALGMTGRNIVDVTASDVPTKSGFLSDMILIEARVEEDSMGKGRNLHLIAKVLPFDPKMRSVVVETKIFDREVEVYNVFGSTEFKDVCQRAGELTLPIPKSAFAMKDDRAGTVLMRNLTRCGYKVFSSSEGLEAPALKVGLESIAQIHATGFLYLKEMDPSQRQDFLPSRMEWEVLEEFVRKGCNIIAEKFPEHPASKVFLEVAGEFRKTLDLPRKHPTFDTVCHGDLWDCNLLYTPDETRAVIIDWQLSEKGNPVMDISCLMMMSASPESLTAEAISNCLQSYWKSLTDVLTAAGAQVPISFQRLEECVNKTWLYGVMVLIASLEMFIEHKKITDRRLEGVLQFVHERNLLHALTLEE